VYPTFRCQHKYTILLSSSIYSSIISFGQRSVKRSGSQGSTGLRLTIECRLSQPCGSLRSRSRGGPLSEWDDRTVYRRGKHGSNIPAVLKECVLLVASEQNRTTECRNMQTPKLLAQRKFVSVRYHAHSYAHKPPKTGSYSFDARIKILTYMYCSHQ